MTVTVTLAQVLNPYSMFHRPMRYDFRFVKYHGCGNDFIIKDEIKGRRTPDGDRSKLAKLLTDRHFWVGADGVLFIERARGYDGSMRLFEPAGNEADMCGNGLRCVASYLMEKLGKDEVDVLTRDGGKHVVKVRNNYKVDMGLVRINRADLSEYVADTGSRDDSMLSFPLTIDGKRIKASIVNTGEPHIVVRVPDINSVDMVKLGEEVNRNRKRFPKYVNFNCIQVTGPRDISVRTYERGVFGETLACGTGATACGGVSLLLRFTKPDIVNVRTSGGRLKIEMGKDGRAFMTGPAVRVFDGRLVVEL